MCNIVRREDMWLRKAEYRVRSRVLPRCLVVARRKGRGGGRRSAGLSLGYSQGVWFGLEEKCIYKWRGGGCMW